MMLEILKKMFEVTPERSTIVLKEKCSACECEVQINITPTSGGYITNLISTELNNGI